MNTLLLSALLLAVNADFKLNCEILTSGRVDPIVFPNQTEIGHAHMFVGSGNISPTSTMSSLRDIETCSSCNVREDQSSYWFPILFAKNGKGELKSLPVLGTFVYYAIESSDIENLIDFPDDFRMIGGNKDAKTSQPGLVFMCDDFTVFVPGFPTDMSCKFIYAKLILPNCWDGLNAYKNDQSHVARSFTNDAGEKVCPDGFKWIPQITVNTKFDLASMKSSGFFSKSDLSNKLELVLSNGDTTGFGFHVDFLHGWKKGVVLEALKKCKSTATTDSLLGLVDADDCPVFKNPITLHSTLRNCGLNFKGFGNAAKFEGKTFNSIDEAAGDANRRSVTIGNSTVSTEAEVAQVNQVVKNNAQAIVLGGMTLVGGILLL